jgi:hypothetical protein
MTKNETMNPYRTASHHYRHARRYGVGYGVGVALNPMEQLAKDCLIAREWVGAWQIALSGMSPGYVGRSLRAGHIRRGMYPLNRLPLP